MAFLPPNFSAQQQLFRLAYPTSTTNRRFDFRHVDFFHRHHRLERSALLRSLA